MLKPEIKEILENSKETGWVLEPDAKRILSMSGVEVPRFKVVQSIMDAVAGAAEIGYPLVAKVVSPAVVHKTDAGGVVVGIKSEPELRDAWQRLSAMERFSGVLMEEMLSGTELIVGGKIDFQFGPVVLLGIGGTAVEIYQDTALRMAPLKEWDVERMAACLKGRKLLEGYRGAAPVSMDSLKKLMLRFSELLMALEAYVDSVDLNPVICCNGRCVAADARIILVQSSCSAGDRPRSDFEEL